MAQPFRYFRKSTRQWESVSEERWQWEVVYEDGRSLKQFDEGTRLFHNFSEEVELRESFVFVLKKKETGQSLRILIKPGMKPFYFYRWTGFNMAKPNHYRVKQLIFGFEREHKKHYWVINPNDDILYVEDDDIKLVAPKS